MPKISLPISGTYEAITRPVTYSIVKEVMPFTGLNEEERIFFPGEDKQGIMKGSTLESQSIDTKTINGDPSFSSENKVTVSVEENFVEEYILATPVKRHENIYCFYDDKLKVGLKPTYAPTELVMTISFRAQDKTTAEAWRDRIKNSASMGMESLLHELNYHYAIPEPFIIILDHIHKLRESKAGYGEELGEYLRANFTNRLVTKTNVSGSKALLAINEKQVGLQGWFDFSGAPEKGQGSDTNAAWTIDFTYTVVYDKVVGCVLEYPLVVHNQVINKKFRPEFQEYDFARKNNYRSFTRKHTDKIIGADTFRHPVAGYSLPWWDTWYPEHVKPKTTTMLLVMIVLDENDLSDVVDLTDLADYKLSELATAFCKKYHTRLTRSGASPIQVTLYRGGLPLSDDSLTVDELLNVRSKEDLDLREPYHVRVSVTVDLLALPSETQKLLLDEGAFTIELLKALDPKCAAGLSEADLVGGYKLPNKIFKKVAQCIKDKLRPHHTGIEYNKLHIGQYVIVTDSAE